MQSNLAGALAEDFRQSSTGPQPPQTELIRSIAHGDRRAMHALFAECPEWATATEREA
jgi:hypothetical protein